MTKGFKTGLIALLAIVLAMGTLLAGCGDKSGKADEQIFRMNLKSEPPTMDPAQMQDNTSGTVANAIFEGLTVTTKEGKVEPGVAKEWKISDDGLVYTFTIRDDAKWSNGDAVTAEDFEYAWKRILDPNTTPAPPYAYQLYYIKNAAKFNAPAEIEKEDGTKEANPDHLADWSQVGIKVLDSKTLEITLENQTPYFLGLTSFYTYYPVHKATVEADPAWAAEASTLISNGPFKMQDWTHNDTITLVPNENYWNKDIVNFTEVRLAMVEDPNTELSMYKTGELDYSGEPTGEIESEQFPFLKEELPEEFNISPIASTYYYVFNTTADPFDNVNIRKAFAKAIDRQLLIDKVTLGGEVPAYGFVPPGLIGEKKTFREEHSEADYFKESVEEAKELLAKGLQEKGIDKLPEITLIHNVSAGHKKLAEAIANMWKENLGANIKVEQQEWGVFLTNRTNLNYQVARAGWLPDYNDPMTFIDMWTSTSGNNDSGWKSTKYDDLVKKAYATGDQKVRMEAMAEAEKLLVQEDMVVMPIYYYTNASLKKPYVKDVFTDYKGDIFFNEGYISKD